MTLLSRTSYTCVSDCCFVVTLHQYTLLEGRELLLMLLCLLMQEPLSTSSAKVRVAWAPTRLATRPVEVLALA